MLSQSSCPARQAGTVSEGPLPRLTESPCAAVEGLEPAAHSRVPEPAAIITQVAA